MTTGLVADRGKIGRATRPVPWNLRNSVSPGQEFWCYAGLYCMVMRRIQINSFRNLSTTVYPACNVSTLLRWGRRPIPNFGQVFGLDEGGGVGGWGGHTGLSPWLTYFNYLEILSTTFNRFQENIYTFCSFTCIKIFGLISRKLL